MQCPVKKRHILVGDVYSHISFFKEVLACKMSIFSSEAVADYNSHNT